MKYINCPHCGAQYTPQEIYLPTSFFGNIKHVEKDDNGKIIDFIGEQMDLKESYKCDYCLKKFYIVADLKFNTDVDSVGFNKTYSTKLNKPSLFMKED